MLDITRAVLNRSNVRRRPSGDSSQLGLSMRASFGDLPSKPTQRHNPFPAHDDNTIITQARRHARASRESIVHAPSTTKMTRSGPAHDENAVGVAGISAHQRKIAFTVDLPSFPRSRARSAQDPFSRPEKLHRITGHITPKARLLKQASMGKLKVPVTPNRTSSDEDSEGSPPMRFAKTRSSEDSASSLPMAFAGILSTPSISHHVFTATSPSVYSVTEPDATQLLKPVSLVPQLVDRSTGVVFESVSEGTSGLLSTQDTEQLEGAEYILRYSLTPQDSRRRSSAPSLALTIPTPNVRPSPIFQLPSPFTFSKFIAAASREESPVRADGTDGPLRHPIPTAPRCNSCAILDGEGACSRACRQQLLACKVWYHASDSGRRRRLTEPFVRPAESTASSRNVMHGLGLPVGSPRGLGIDIAAEETREASMDMQPGLGAPIADLAPPSVPEQRQQRADVRVLRSSSSGPSRLWKGLKKVVRPRSPSDPARFVHAMVGRARSQSTSMLEVAVRTSSVTVREAC